MLSPDQQAAYESRILEVVERVRAMQFENNLALSTYFHRSFSWSSAMKAAILKRGLLTEEEWSSSFSKRSIPQGRTIECPQCHQRISLLKNKGTT